MSKQIFTYSKQFSEKDLGKLTNFYISKFMNDKKKDCAVLIVDINDLIKKLEKSGNKLRNSAYYFDIRPKYMVELENFEGTKLNIHKLNSIFTNLLLVRRNIKRLKNYF